jgi:hypothetical protein
MGLGEGLRSGEVLHEELQRSMDGAGRGTEEWW